MSRKKPTHGGKRQGAGRPTEDDAQGLKRVIVMLNDHHVQAAKKIGGGNVSLGIRRALSKAT
jgi:hypothetical protein